jgi:hypothetical protein
MSGATRNTIYRREYAKHYQITRRHLLGRRSRQLECTRNRSIARTDVRFRIAVGWRLANQSRKDLTRSAFLR